MSETAIKVDGLSKRYRIGLKEEIHDTFVGAAISFIRSPLKNLKRLRALSTFEDGEEAEDIIWALKDVSFEVKQGEVVGIIGRNGAGKSTLLKILAGITYPTTGRVEMNGRVASLLEVGTGFHHELTGRENVYLNGTILGMTRKEIDRKFDEIVDFSGVEKFIDTPVKRYSSGMRVRLAFSVAAHLEAEILLIDEVLAVGDTAFQQKCLGKMGEVSKGGRTVLFVSHNLGAVVELCKLGLYLSNGELKKSGYSKEVIDMYILDLEQDTKPKVSIQNYPVSFIEVRVNNKENEINCNQKIIVSSSVETLVDHENLRLNYILYDSFGKKVFHLQKESMDIIGKPLTAGLYEINVEIPPLWITPGFYTLVLKIRTIKSSVEDKLYASAPVPVKVFGIHTVLPTTLNPLVNWEILKGAEERK